MTVHDTISAQGWKLAPDGSWLSPLTGNRFTEREALAIASLKPRNRNPIYRPRRFARQ